MNIPGYLCEISSAVIDDSTGILEISSVCLDSKNCLRNDFSTYKCISKFPSVSDPWESNRQQKFAIQELKDQSDDYFLGFLEWRLKFLQ